MLIQQGSAGGLLNLSNLAHALLLQQLVLTGAHSPLLAASLVLATAALTLAGHWAHLDQERERQAEEAMQRAAIQKAADELAEARMRSGLIAQLGSRVNDVARFAAEEIRRNGWLSDGTLRGALLARANLQGSSLANADLQEADLRRANLQQSSLVGVNFRAANLSDSNLEGAGLREADLQGANLERANLRKAGLRQTNLRDADLRGANLFDARLWDAGLQGANLTEANLEQAVFQGARLDETSILPDGAHWSEATDLSQFTDPSHPHFWRSERIGSAPTDGIPGQRIRVKIALQQNDTVLEISVGPTITGEQLIEALLNAGSSKPFLPRMTDTGTVVEYTLVVRRTGQRLASKTTLEDAGVTDGDQIDALPEFRAG
jgi:uncharacterized protein YjbI with pentapeptide repeats